MNDWKVPVQSLIDHIKTAADVDPWAKEMAEELLKKYEAVEPIRDDDDYPRCRSCNAYVAFPNGDCKKSFCEKCGKAVLWK